ncbi:6-phosphogluconolactonase [Pseudomonadota bacterium]
MHNIHIYPDAAALIDAAAARWIELARDAIQQRSSFHVALSGGTTPAALHRYLGSQDMAGEIDWSQVHIWFGDERCVPPDHPDSNYRMARETLLQTTPIPADQIHRMRGELPQPPEAARQYGEELAGTFGTTGAFPRFDLIMLGIGTDGHIASLFPDSDNLREQQAAVSAAWIDEQKGWRLSLTLPVIQNAHHVMLLASGENKAAILQRIFRDRSGAKQLPAASVRDLPQTEWHLDIPAAKLIDSPSTLPQIKTT